MNVSVFCHVWILYLALEFSLHNENLFRHLNETSHLYLKTQTSDNILLCFLVMFLSEFTLLDEDPSAVLSYTILYEVQTVLYIFNILEYKYM